MGYGTGPTLSVTATGSNLSFQWCRDSVSYANQIDVATSASYQVETGLSAGVHTYKCVVKSGTYTLASDPITLTVKSSQAATTPTLNSRTANSITINSTSGQMYAITETASAPATDADDTWTAATGGVFTFDNLTAGTTYYIWTYALETQAAAASDVVGTTIATLPATTLDVSAPTFESAFTGYAQPEAKAITISNTGNSDAAISDVTVDNASFVIGGSGSSVPAGGSISTWTIRPAAGLAAGTHTATITVAYNDGATATAQVSSTVTRRPSSGVSAPDWEDITDDISSAADGSVVRVDMEGETVLPGWVLGELAGRDVTLALDMGGGVSWEIYGGDVPEGAGHGDTDLGVSLGGVLSRAQLAAVLMRMA